MISLFILFICKIVKILIYYILLTIIDTVHQFIKFDLSMPVKLVKCIYISRYMFQNPFSSKQSVILIIIIRLSNNSIMYIHNNTNKQLLQHLRIA